jgi:2-C-methyl-D-erythritol 4-phosphate cytidylyltransferase
MRYWLVMPAAGSGSRFGAHAPKQYAPLAGRTVIEWALAPFLADPRCAHLVLALAEHDAAWGQVAARLGSPSRVSTVTGGAQRSQSVRRGLEALSGRAAPDDWVLVHDAARPCLEATDLERLLGELAAHPVGGLLATPATDTLKRAGAATAPHPAVAATVDRRHLWRALTPQMFRYGALCAALDSAHAAGRFASDEAEALEWRGQQPVLIGAAPSNLKITIAEDLVLAAALLAARPRAPRAEGT